ncbi:MAG: hypothetical protein ACR2P5_04220 [Gammaproteobacteria bacterium]
MLTRELKTEDGNAQDKRDADMIGNNAVFTCPNCEYIYIVTTAPPCGNLKEGKGSRDCPRCKKSTVHIERTRKRDKKTKLRHCLKHGLAQSK